jgi:shikimate kinase
LIHATTTIANARTIANPAASAIPIFTCRLFARQLAVLLPAAALVNRRSGQLALCPSPTIGNPAMEHDTLSHAQIQQIAARLDRSVVLVGMMGVGKTTVGRKLAGLLGVPFVDADEEIERAAQMAIPEIFAQYGEPYFRDGERRVIARLIGSGDPRKVLATGGGAFVDPATRQLILDRAVAVWIDSDIDTLVERVSRKDNRPLLRGGDRREILSRLHRERAPLYAHAPIHVVSAHQPHGVTAHTILKAIDAWL